MQQSWNEVYVHSCQVSSKFVLYLFTFPSSDSTSSSDCTVSLLFVSLFRIPIILLKNVISNARGLCRLALVGVHVSLQYSTTGIAKVLHNRTCVSKFVLPLNLIVSIPHFFVERASPLSRFPKYRK